MPNTKAIGVAYADPQLDSVTVTGNSQFTGNVTISGNLVAGDAATDLVGFHGSTGTSQATFISSNSINALSVSGVVGFISSTSLSSLVGKVNSILQILSDHGLMAAS